MVELVKTIAENLVENPEAISVTSRQEDGTLIIEIHAEPSELGRIIGKDGKIAKAIRTVVKAAAIKDGIKVLIKIL